MLKLTVPSPLKPFHTFLLSLFFSSKTLINPSFQVSHSTTPSRIIPFLSFSQFSHNHHIHYPLRSNYICNYIFPFLSFISTTETPIFWFRCVQVGVAEGFDFSAAENLGKIRLLNKKRKVFFFKVGGLGLMRIVRGMQRSLCEDHYCCNDSFFQGIGITTPKARTRDKPMIQTL